MVPAFTFAFHPIVDIDRRTAVSYEALVRGPQGQSADWVLSQLTAAELLEFDANARPLAIRLAARLGLEGHLTLNLLPDSLTSDDDAMAATMDALAEVGFANDRLLLEVSETKTIGEYRLFVERVNNCREIGIKFAIDDFGKGYSGLNLLAEFQPEALKLDMQLVSGIHRRGPRQAIVRGVLRTCEDLGIDVIAEGVEDIGEMDWLIEEGVHLFQGFLFAEPGFECLPAVEFPR